MSQINRVRWIFGDQRKLRSSPTWLAKARIKGIKGSLEWVQYHSPGTEVRYVAFSRLPMILNTTDKLRSRRTAVLKAPVCPQQIPGESRHPPRDRSCRHLEERLLTWDGLHATMSNPKPYNLLTEGNKLIESIHSAKEETLMQHRTKSTKLTVPRLLMKHMYAES